MKSSLEVVYKPPSGYTIDRVIIADHEKTLVFLYPHGGKNSSIVELLKFGVVDKRINLSALSGYDSPLAYKKACMVLNNELIIIMPSGEIAFLDLIEFKKFRIFKINNFNGRNFYNGIIYPALMTYNSFSNEYVVAFTDNIVSPRYLSSISESGFFTKKIIIDKFIELPREQYPISKFQISCGNLDPYGEWVNIKNLFCKDDKIFIHTLGRSHPRVRNDVYSDFSLISTLDENLKFISNHEIVDGLGYASSSGDFFMVNPRKNKKKIYFYNTSNFEKEDELSLTPKQNLGVEENKWIKFSMVREIFILYNTDFLHFCTISA